MDNGTLSVCLDPTVYLHARGTPDRLDVDIFFRFLVRSDRAKYRARRAHEQNVGGFEDTQDTAFDIVQEVRRGDDRIQSNADRLQRAV